MNGVLHINRLHMGVGNFVTDGQQLTCLGEVAKHESCEMNVTCMKYSPKL